VFETKQLRGVLHRAFSVFLFDESTGELLLQQRASTKITFPNVWTNTCCSHPLHGMVPNEVDTPKEVADGSVMGVKHAAIRKLDHELRITSLDASKFKFLTRLHYWAADTVTHGPSSPWGEHEIDYVLFYTIPNKAAIQEMNPHPDEVDAVKWVTKTQLVDMMNDPQLLFSPWFRIIANRWVLPEGTGWWENLQDTMTTDKHCDFVNIHAFDPPKEHLGGGGNAGPMFEKEEQQSKEGDEMKKQGAYGKIKTHKESKIKQLLHTDEVWSALTLLYIKPLKSNLESEFIHNKFAPEDLAFCDEILGKVSRSFAAVIRQLPSSMLVDILIFYLVLRALDTIEDDTTSFASQDEKMKYLLNFHKTALVDPTWTLEGVGLGDEKRLLEEFPKCQSVYAALGTQSKRVIADITQRMATGMAEFVDKDLGQGTRDTSEYNRYCHFVAGLVGEGLSRLFAASGLEKPSMASELHLSDQMGMFLQKVNIIRDYLEDYVDGRAWWPQTVWKKYSLTGDLGYFANPATTQVQTKALHCLNELVTDALELGPDCLAYMSKLQCEEVFRFCAIPQVMAISTLDKCYGNLDVFTGVVKIRKGLSCKLILKTNSLEQVHETFYNFATSISRKARKQKSKGFVDPNYDRTIKACDAICELTIDAASAAAASRRKSSLALPVALGTTVFASYMTWCYGGTGSSGPQFRLGALQAEESQKVLRGIVLVCGAVFYLNSPFASSEQKTLKSANELEPKLKKV